MTALGTAFRLAPDSEISIEVDPRTVTPDRLAHFRKLGFNRLSFGVQDFDPEVQKAVHRVQSFEMVKGLIESARELGYLSINADLIYGLPKQTPESFARTVQQIGELRPDRIALYAYAHLPERFKPQRRIAEVDLPSATQRIAMLGRRDHRVPDARLLLHRDGPLRASERPAGGGEARRSAAPQLPGVQHAARLRPRGAWRFGHRSGWRCLLPEREDTAGVLRVSQPTPAARRPGLRLDR